MFRDMRREKQALSREAAIEILERNTAGVLAVFGDEDYPYAVPLSYVYADSKIYFHCAKVGHKIDGILKSDKVSFCVIDQDLVVPEEYTTYYRSVIVFGRAKILEGEAKRVPLEKLGDKYHPDHMEQTRRTVERSFQNVCLVELTIEHLTGKEAVELAAKA